MQLRLDIQIMRGFAVLLVVAFHLGLGGFSGGFLGVDLFFVLSGFLMAVLYRTGDIGGFYRRRASRLLPAYFATVFCTVAASAIITLPAGHNQVVEQGLFASFFASNVGFWAQNSYFSKSEFSPLLHLWSLGVEAQFYAIVPLIAWATAKSKWLFVAMLSGSLILCLLVVFVSPKTAFFMMPFRIWQFLAGFAVARWLTNGGKVATKRPWVGMAFWVATAAAAMLIPIDELVTNPLLGHPGVASILVVFGTCAVLAYGLPKYVEVSLAGKALSKLGDWSYSIYLAHFPVIVLYLYQPLSGTILTPATMADTAILLGLIATASAFLYILFDRARWYRGALAPALSAAVGAATFALVSVTISEKQYSVNELQFFAAATDQAEYRCGRIFRITNPTAEYCEITQLSSDSPAVFLVGDSHANSIKRSFARVAERRGKQTYFTVSNRPLLNARAADRIVRMAQKQNSETIFLHFSSSNARQAISTGIAEKANTAGIGVVWLLPVPTYSEDVPKALWAARTQGGPFPFVRNAGQIREISTSLEALDVPAVETAIHLCEMRCDVADENGNPIYFDDDHLTLSGARRLEPGFELAFDLANRL